MKEDKSDCSRTMQELKNLQMRNKKFVIWKLSDGMRMKVELIYPIEEYIYEIKTRPFRNIHYLKNEKLVEIHMANKNKKRTICRTLTKEDMEELKKYGVKFRPVKYKIYLCS